MIGRGGFGGFKWSARPPVFQDACTRLEIFHAFFKYNAVKTRLPALARVGKSPWRQPKVAFSVALDRHFNAIFEYSRARPH